MDEPTTEIHTWFPTSIYKVDNLLLDHLDNFEKCIKKFIKRWGTGRTDTLAIDSTHFQFQPGKEVPQLFGEPKIIPLVDQIYWHTANYLRTLGATEEFIEKCTMCNMWANISHKGDFITPHVHGHSNISGVFYVKTYENSKINFYKNIYAMTPIEGNYNDLSFGKCYYECLPGRLLLFQSDTLHGTPMQTSGEKIAISFNMGYW